jgi:inner membrane protein
MAVRLWNFASPAAKAFTIGFIVLLLLFPLAQLRSLVSERTSLRDEAYAKVASGWGGSSIVGGPMLVIPTERRVLEGQVIKIVRSEHYFLPDRLAFDVQLVNQPDPLRVGIYSVPVYLAHIHINGEFVAHGPRTVNDETLLFGEARLRLPLAEVRTLHELKATFAEQSLVFAPATGGLYHGLDAQIHTDQNAAGQFSIDLTVAGSRDFSLLPLGATTEAHVAASWRDPSFQGAFLPADRKISSQGFDARWQVLELNRDFGSSWEAGEVNDARLVSSTFGVTLFQSVDIYQRAERAMKYALVFIALTFLSFFAWEQISRIRLHPMQYLLVGLALSVFYLLLIALSEHVDFGWAYLTAAVALVSLIGVYVGSIMRSAKRGGATGALMATVYGVLYMLVLSEDYALLMGAIAVFVALAAVMLLTRKVEWGREPVAEE